MPTLENNFDVSGMSSAELTKIANQLAENAKKAKEKEEQAKKAKKTSWRVKMFLISGNVAQKKTQEYEDFTNLMEDQGRFIKAVELPLENGGLLVKVLYRPEEGAK